MKSNKTKNFIIIFYKINYFILLIYFFFFFTNLQKVPCTFIHKEHIFSTYY